MEKGNEGVGDVIEGCRRDGELWKGFGGKIEESNYGGGDNFR